MAKMAKQVKAVNEVIVRYDLLNLPTAQHKAGLAGLVLQIESMNERRDRGADLPPPPEVLDDRGATFAEVRFTAESTQALFDDLYDATLDKPAEVKGKNDKARLVPAGNFLRTYTDDGKEIWHKLWREALWSTLRLKPRAIERKFGSTAQGQPSPDGKDAWKALQKHEEANRDGVYALVPSDTAVTLNSQKANAELVSFEDRADHALLTHFWQITVGIYVPTQMMQDGKAKKWEEEFVGYVIVVPEVSDIQEFTYAYKQGLSLLSAKPHRYRPAEAIVSLPDQGGLAFMRQLDRLVPTRYLTHRPPTYLSGVEFFHMVKLGNNVKTASHGRVPASDQLLTRYDGLMSRGGPKNPVMLAGRLQALLDEAPWFAALEDDLVEREWSWFVHSRKEGHATPPAMRSFAWDAARGFQQIKRRIANMNAETSAGNRIEPPEVVDRIIYRMVEECVIRRARARMNVPEEAPHRGPTTHRRVTGADGQPRWQELPEFQEKRREVASNLYLKLRSRHGDDFVEQFTVELGAVAQYLPVNDYAAVSAALMRSFTDDVSESRPRTRDDVKILTLLALSANSRSLTTRSDENQTDQPADNGEGE